MGRRGRFVPPTPLPVAVAFGAWRPYTWTDAAGTRRRGVEVVAERAAWHELFQALDELGRGLSDAPVNPSEEADAVVAACWRYGSYTYVLAAGEVLPQRVRDAGRIGDDEMARVNREFSAGLCRWWRDRESDPGLVHRRVRAALVVLPMDWRTPTGPAPFSDGIDASLARLLEGVPRLVPAGRPLPALRTQANGAIGLCYREGPIERIHGQHREITGPKDDVADHLLGFCRFAPAELGRVARTAAVKLAPWLSAWSDPASRTAAAHALGAIAPAGWTSTEDVSPIRYPGVPGAEDVADRLTWLASRAPSLFGSDVLRAPVGGSAGAAGRTDEPNYPAI